VKDTFYTDPELKLQDASGEIKPEDIQSLQDMLLSAISNKTEFANWFGHFITNNLDELEPEHDLLDESTFISTLKKQASHLNRYGNIRFSYIKSNDTVTLFYSGESLLLSNAQLSLVKYLCSSHCLDCTELLGFNDQGLSLDILFTLYSAGCFYFDE
ncbi:MAG: 50S ribosomal protein L16 3-hydroxylase, partial [Gammaproteobacteria bacterium]